MLEVVSSASWSQQPLFGVRASHGHRHGFGPRNLLPDALDAGRGLPSLRSRAIGPLSPSMRLNQLMRGDTLRDSHGEGFTF